MSKKLIAVAAAAALALTGLVAAPASASFSAPTIVDSGTGTGLTSASPLTTAPQTLNSIVVLTSDNRDTNTAVRMSWTGLVSGQTINLRTAATTSVKFLERTTALANTGETINASSGAASLDIAVVGGAAEFYVHNASTTAEAFTVTYMGNTTVYYIKAEQGAPYDVSATFPTTIGASATGNVLVTLKDVRGNVIKGTSDGIGYVADTASRQSVAMTMSVIGSGTVVGNSNGTSFTWSVARNAWVGQISGGASGGSLAATVTLASTDLSSVGFAEPVTSAFASLSAANLAGLTAQVATLTAQVAALQAQLDASRPKATSVTKKRFNTLARKWNRANPTDRVALKK